MLHQTIEEAHHSQRWRHRILFRRHHNQLEAAVVDILVAEAAAARTHQLVDRMGSLRGWEQEERMRLRLAPAVGSQEAERELQLAMQPGLDV